MSRRVYLLGVALALVALALAFTDWALSLQPGVTEANVKRVRVGMTYGEVEDLLGYSTSLKILSNGGPRLSRGEIENLIRSMDAVRVANGGFVVWTWDVEEGSAVIYFGADGLVQRVRWLRAGPSQVSNPLARLRAWLGW